MTLSADIPEGFNGVYRCKHHPERDAEAPIALRLCAECLADAHAAYAGQHDFTPSARYQDERAPDGRSIMKDHEGYYTRNPKDDFDISRIK